MTTYTTIGSGSLAVGKPATSTIALALRDNPLAIAEGNSSAPVLASAWHPYDKVTVGDANNGLVYDFAVSGAVATITSPDFADGYEYQFLFVGIGSSTTPDDFRIELYRATTAAYSTAATFVNSASNPVRGTVAIYTPRFSVNAHFFETKATVIAASNTYGATTNTVTAILHTTAQKLLRVRFSFSTGNVNAGKLYMMRRLAIGI